MLSRLPHRAASQAAAALVALALSGVASVAPDVAGPAAHACRCPKGDHHCTCPVCRTLAAADHPHEGHDTPQPCRVSSACHLPEALAATPYGADPFTLVESGRGGDGAPGKPLVISSTRPRRLERRPEVPPPRAAPRS